MEVAEEQRDFLLDVIVKMVTQDLVCKKKYKCFTSSFEGLCEVKESDTSDAIECQSRDAQCCNLSVAEASAHLCRCPLRQYIFENFHR